MKERISEGAYNTTSKYFRDLIREDQKKRAEARLGVPGKRKIIVTEEARFDVVNIAYSLAENDLKASDRFAEAIDAAYQFSAVCF